MPKSILVEKGENLHQINLRLKKQNFQFPLIIKPDIGFRGLLVQQIHNNGELENYLKQHHFIDLIIQEFIDYKNECGIFYHKIPGAKTGKITSITLKKYLAVTGNGKSTLKELILNNNRAVIFKEMLYKIHKDKLAVVLEKGEESILNVIGNHSKGTQFINGNHLISADLENAFDQLFSNISNVFYGRVDLKYDSFEHLIEKSEFKIIEMNGVISEPTHIYDKENTTYLKALKDFRKHWRLIYEIAVKNNNDFGVKYEKSSTYINCLFKLKKYTNQLKKLRN